MPLLQANGITINYRLEGPESSSDLIVLINGLADDLETWDAQVSDLLEAGYRVLRYDNRGIGHSSRPLGPYTAELLAADLHALLRALDVVDFHLVGVSMGGMIAQSYALAYPNGSAAAQGLRLRSLSLGCTYAQPTEFCARMFALWADVAAAMGVAAVMRDVMLWAFTVPFFRTRRSELEEVERAMDALELGTDEYLAQLNVIRGFDSVRQLEELRAAKRGLGRLEGKQVMVLAGDVDILIPVELSRELAEMVEGSQFLTTKGGHGCMWEFPQQFNSVLLEFLRQHRIDDV